MINKTLSTWKPRVDKMKGIFADTLCIWHTMERIFQKQIVIHSHAILTAVFVSFLSFVINIV